MSFADRQNGCCTNGSDVTGARHVISICLQPRRAGEVRSRYTAGSSLIPAFSMSTQIKDKEAFQRLNFLYQAAHCVLAQNPENVELARFYCHTQRMITKRLVLRQDPSIKRTICKRCSSLLISGVTCTVRQRKLHGQRQTIVRCLSCGLIKRFLSNPNYKLWCEQPEALLENQTKEANPQQGSKEKETPVKTEAKKTV